MDLSAELQVEFEKARASGQLAIICGIAPSPTLELLAATSAADAGM
jgi:hypothetical protein